MLAEVLSEAQMRRLVTAADGHEEEAEIPDENVDEQLGAADVTLDELVRRAQRGVPGAQDALLRELAPMVLRYCRARLGPGQTVLASAEDVAQEVCLAVVAALPSYASTEIPFRAFVYGVAAREVGAALRAVGSNRQDPVAELPDRPGPEQQQLSDRVAALLARLTARQREVVVLRVAVGLSVTETAVEMGTTPGVVRVVQRRALDRLRELDHRPRRPDSDARIGPAYELLVADLAGGTLDLEAGYADATRRGRYDALVADLATRLDLERGLVQILGDE
jgi:RNA polymerase sigma-70 factor, ECF subfamily